MGCDIHVHTEMKINGRWCNYGTPDVPRSYNLFTKMAGVRDRGIVEPISLPRGIPDDASDITKLMYSWWEVDAHSASWLSLSEMEELKQWLLTSAREPQYFSCYFGEILSHYHDMQVEVTYVIEDVRMVFWFDN